MVNMIKKYQNNTYTERLRKKIVYKIINIIEVLAAIASILCTMECLIGLCQNAIEEIKLEKRAEKRMD